LVEERRIAREAPLGSVAVGHDQVQSRRIKEGVIVEAGPSSEENNLSAAQSEARHDFSGVQGFQVVPAEGHSAPQTASDQAWRDALRLELEVRAARFHQAVDTAIVLSNDGIIRWLGDPVARLSPSPDLLNPRAVIFADESLPAGSRDIIKTRVELWIAATTRRILAPLFALQALEEGSEIVRDLARDLTRSLGILEREPIKAQIKGLAQKDRAELRRHGVRFGAHYIFIPALIKPAPRTLALQLWGLQASGDAAELLRTLGSAASSGRTSLSLDRGISKEGYRVAGYRPCGERVVRVDVVERLAGMIRAAIGEPAAVGPGQPSFRTAKGFIVNGQMTSLTGCSAEQFASILRSLGFRAVEVKRSEFFGSPSANEMPEQGEALASAEVQGARHPASSIASCKEAPPVESVLAAPDESLPGAVPEDAVAEDAVPEDAPSPVSAGRCGALDEGTGAEDASAQTSGASYESAKHADMIVVWRPDRRRVWPNREREDKQAKSPKSGPPGRLDSDGRAPVQTPKRPVLHPSEPSRFHPAHADEKHRQQASECDMPRSGPTTEPQHKAKVDPNSPFAKLLELRPLLEEQANKRP
jgi:ATP-dependent RNA helicase SUPV3L1/SUV3